MNHTEKIIALILENGYKSYLEIGYGQGNNFNAIDVEKKTAVDPELKVEAENLHAMTSDAYFESIDGRTKFEIVLIDGLHHADQVERDIVNSWKHLKKGGCLVIHDVAPHNEAMTKVPRETKEWCGTVYQAWAGLLEAYPDLKTEFSADDYGVGVVYFDKDIKIEPGFAKLDLSFDDYKA